MTRSEASHIAVGDKVIYMNYYDFEVKDIRYNVDMKRVLFIDRCGNPYIHTKCRRYNDVRTKDSVETD